MDHAGRGSGRLEVLGVRDARGQRLLTDDVHAGLDHFVGQVRCVWFGVQMWTTSTSPSVSACSSEVYADTAPNRVAAAAAWSALRETTAATVPPAARTARAWTSPMNPVPTMTDRRG